MFSETGIQLLQERIFQPVAGSVVVLLPEQQDAPLRNAAYQLAEADLPAGFDVIDPVSLPSRCGLRPDAG
ncbi:hypothetical protein [Compostibacter hankyongensis]|uniref:Uncharacterized protein n=1 Tax=Compostibacter hankyongensis TaxID=1007089 RepID=A0ABP8G4Y4_9BACT